MTKTRAVPENLDAYEFGLRLGQLEVLGQPFTEHFEAIPPLATPKCPGSREQQEILYAIDLLRISCQQVLRVANNKHRDRLAKRLLRQMKQSWQSVFKMCEYDLAALAAGKQRHAPRGARLHHVIALGAQINTLVAATLSPTNEKWRDLGRLLASSSIYMLTEGKHDNFRVRDPRSNSNETAWVWNKPAEISEALQDLKVTWSILCPLKKRPLDAVPLLPYNTVERWPWFLLEAGLKLMRPRAPKNQSRPDTKPDTKNIISPPPLPENDRLRTFIRRVNAKSSTETKAAMALDLAEGNTKTANSLLRQERRYRQESRPPAN